MAKVKERKLKIEICEVEEYQLQRIDIFATEKDSFVEALNRGGGRLVLRNASCPLDEAKSVARKLNIDVID